MGFVLALSLAWVAPTSANATAGLAESWQAAGAFPDPYADWTGYPPNNCRSEHTAGLTDGGSVWVVSGTGCWHYHAEILAGPGWTPLPAYDSGLPGYDTGRWTGSALARYGPHFIDVGGNLNSGAAHHIYRLTPTGSLYDYGVAGHLPLPLQHATASIHNGWLFVTGGWSDFGVRADVRVAAVGSDGNLGSFRSLPNLPGKRWAHQAVVVRNRLYVIGGSDYSQDTPSGGRKSTVWHASINSNGTLGAWQNAAPLPEPLFSHEAVTIGDDIYVVGGESPTGTSDRTHYASVDPADGSIDSWETAAQLLPGGGRSSHAAVAKDNKIVVTGGSGHPNAVEVTTTSEPGNFALLDKYRPELRYDLMETYRADSAATITDNCVMNGTKVGRQNRLNDDRGRTKAAACPVDRADDLSLGYLGTYAAASGDRVDADNNYATDAQRLHASGAYANKTYGRVVDHPNGFKTLQYWFFYYHNPKDYAGFGVHEGDWETAQIHLDAALNPTGATYSQHSGAERCEWDHVQRTVSDRPIVYVAEGSHANYFSSGYHVNWGGFDTSNGDGEWTVPIVEDITTVPAWMNWPGRWGGSSNSPRSPSGQGVKWSDPFAWVLEAYGCTEEQTQGSSAASKAMDRPVTREAAKTAPTLPRARAELVGDRVRIRFTFKRGALADRHRPRMLITSVDTAGSKYPPLTKRSRVKRRLGIVSQPVGLGKRPIKVRIATEGANGARSRIVRVSVR